MGEQIWDRESNRKVIAASDVEKQQEEYTNKISEFMYNSELRWLIWWACWDSNGGGGWFIDLLYCSLLAAELHLLWASSPQLANELY